MIFTIIEYTPSSAEYDGCDRAYYSYNESELDIKHYDDYEYALIAANRTSSDSQTTILIDGVDVDDIIDTDEPSELRTMAIGLRSLL